MGRNILSKTENISKISLTLFAEFDILEKIVKVLMRINLVSSIPCPYLTVWERG